MVSFQIFFPAVQAQLHRIIEVREIWGSLWALLNKLLLCKTRAACFIFVPDLSRQPGSHQGQVQEQLHGWAVLAAAKGIQWAPLRHCATTFTWKAFTFLCFSLLMSFSVLRVWGHFPCNGSTVMWVIKLPKLPLLTGATTAGCKVLTVFLYSSKVWLAVSGYS